MTASNGKHFRVTGPSWGESTGQQWFTVTRNFDVFSGLRLNKRLSKQSRRRRFETPSRLLRRHWNVTVRMKAIVSDNISSPLMMPVQFVEFTLVWIDKRASRSCLLKSSEKLGRKAVEIEFKCNTIILINASLIISNTAALCDAKQEIALRTETISQFIRTRAHQIPSTSLIYCTIKAAEYSRNRMHLHVQCIPCLPPCVCLVIWIRQKMAVIFPIVS